jgi:hypothetical protein
MESIRVRSVHAVERLLARVLTRLQRGIGRTGARDMAISRQAEDAFRTQIHFLREVTEKKVVQEISEKESCG